MEVDAVNDIGILQLMLSQYRVNGFLDALSIFVFSVDSLFSGSNDNILPEPLKLGIRKGLSFAISNYILRGAFGFGFPQTIYQAARYRNIPLGSFGL